MNMKVFLHDNKATILACAGVAGVTATAILSAKATPKALALIEEQEELKQANHGEPLTRFEKFLVAAPVYAPTALMVLATSACILVGDKLHREEQKALLGAYMTLSSTFMEYQRKVKDVFGEEAAERIKNEIKEDYEWMEEYGVLHEIQTFYDPYSDRYFEMSFYDFQQAEYKANRMFNFLGKLTLNEFYDFYGMESTDNGDDIGWSAFKDWECIGYSWIEINYDRVTTKDGIDAYAIKFNLEPTADFDLYTY